MSNFYPKYAGDYLRDTMHLSLTEHGAYNLLMDTYYATEKPLPAEIESLYRICHAMGEVEQAAVRKVADAYFPVNGDGLRHNKRCDEELAKLAKMKQGGAIGAARRWGNREGNWGGINPPYANQNQNQNQNQIQEPEKPLRSLRKRTPEKQGGSLTSIEKPPTSNEGTGRVWAAYEEGYERRYGAKPVRNAKVNAQLVQLVQRIGIEDAVGVAGFFPAHGNGYYVSRGHAVGIMLADAEKLRTEWATGRRATQVEARAQDRRQGLVNAFAPLIAEASKREERREEPTE